MIETKKTKLWSALCFVMLVVFVAVKTCFSITQKTNGNFQLVFMSLVFAFLAFLLGLILLKRNFFKQQIPLCKSPIMGGLCAIISALYFLSLCVGIREPIAKADFWNNKLMFFIKTVFVISTFIVMSMSFFSGKNAFKSCEVLAFGFVTYQIISVLTTLTLENHDPELCQVLAKSSMLLFSLYHVNSFLAISEKFMTKTLIFFGYSAALFTLMTEIPNLILKLQSAFALNTSLINSVIDAVLCVYILLFLLFINKISVNNNHGV